MTHAGLIPPTRTDPDPPRDPEDEDPLLELEGTRVAPPPPVPEILIGLLCAADPRNRQHTLEGVSNVSYNIDKPPFDRNNTFLSNLAQF